MYLHKRFLKDPLDALKTTFANLVLSLLSRKIIQSLQGKCPRLCGSPECWPVSPRFPGMPCPACSSWQALAAVEKAKGRHTACHPLSAASSSYSQAQFPFTVSSQQAMRVCLRFKDPHRIQPVHQELPRGVADAVQCYRDRPIPRPAYLM